MCGNFDGDATNDIVMNGAQVDVQKQSKIEAFSRQFR